MEYNENMETTLKRADKLRVGDQMPVYSRNELFIWTVDHIHRWYFEGELARVTVTWKLGRKTRTDRLSPDTETVVIR